MGYTKMSEEEDNDINDLKMDELRKIGKELDVTGKTKIKLKRNIKAARKEKEKKKQELKISNEELEKRRNIQEEQQSKKKTLNVQQMLDKKHPEKAIKAYPKEIVEIAKKKLADNETKRKKEPRVILYESDDHNDQGVEQSFVLRTWEDLKPEEKLELLIQAAAEYAKKNIKKTEKTAENKTEEEEGKKEKLQKIEDEMLKKKKEQEKSLKTKELKKMQQHYPMDKVLNEAFLKEKLQKHVYTVFNIISNGGKLNKKEETGFHEFITDALWLTNSYKTAEYGDNQINTMNSLQSYVIFSNVLMMLQNLKKKSPRLIGHVRSSILGTRGDNSNSSPLENVKEQLGVTLEWCTNIVSFLDNCIEEGEIRTFYTPQLKNNAHIRKHLMEELFDEDRIAEIENFFNIRLEYAAELGLDYEKLNLPLILLGGAPEWCKAIPMIGKDRPFTYHKDVPEAIIGKKIRLKKIRSSPSPEDNSEGIFYRVINDEKIGDLVVHKIVPFKKGVKKDGDSFLVHLDLAKKKAVQKIDPKKESSEEEVKLEKMDEEKEKSLIAIETPSKETKWRLAKKNQKIVVVSVFELGKKVNCVYCQTQN